MFIIDKIMRDQDSGLIVNRENNTYMLVEPMHGGGQLN